MAKKDEEMIVDGSADNMGLPDQAEFDFEVDDYGVPIVWKPKDKGDFIQGKFIGLKLVHMKMVNESFTQGLIMGDGEVYAVSGWYLENKLQTFPEGVYIRITYKGTIETGKNRNPMKNYEIAVAKKDRAKVQEFRDSLKGDSKNGDLPF